MTLALETTPHEANQSGIPPMVGDFDSLGFWASFTKAAKKDLPANFDTEKFYPLHGVFSAETKDLEGEILNQDGVEEGLKKYFFPLNAQIDWEHKYRETRDSKWLIGECFSFRPTTIKRGGKRYRALYGLFGLYKSPKKEVARGVIDHIEAGGKLGASVDGARLDGGKDNDGVTKKVAILRISLTPNPVNTDTWIKKYDAFIKALTTAGAAPMGVQDLEGAAVVRREIRDLRSAYVDLGMSEKEVTKNLAEHFGEHIKKGTITMSDLAKSAQELEAASSELLEGLAPHKEGEDGEDGSSKLTKAISRLTKNLKSLVKGKPSEDEGGEDEGDEGDEEYEKAVKAFTAYDRRKMVEMAKNYDAYDAMRGKKEAKDVVASLTAKLGKGGFVKMVANGTMDKSLAMEDDALLKALEAESLEDADTPPGEGDEVVVLGDTQDYQALTKAIGALQNDRTAIKGGVAVLCKAIGVITEKLGEQERFFAALCKAMNFSLPSRAFQASSQAADGKDKGAGIPVSPDKNAAARSKDVVLKALTEKQTGDSPLTSAEVSLVKSAVVLGQPVPDGISAKLFPVQ